MLRRRPPRLRLSLRSVEHILLLLLLISLARAQEITTLPVPSTITFNLTGLAASAFFHIPATDDTTYITLSLCAPPSTLQETLPASLPSVLFASTSSDNQLPGPVTATSQDERDGLIAGLEQGFSNVTLASANQDGAWIGVWTPSDLGDVPGVWSYELSVSVNAPLVVLDERGSFKYEDSDESSALLTTSNWTSRPDDVGTAVPRFQIAVSRTSPLSSSLASSKCFVQSLGAATANSSQTTRGFGGGRRMQYALSSLLAGSNYTSWLLESTTSGVRLRSPSFFATKSTNKCRLLPAVPSCPDIAYSVPAPPSLPTADVITYYDSLVVPYITNFTRTLTTFPCNSTTFGSYSFVSTCDDCLDAYRRFVCATTIPRCTDAPPDVAINDSTSTAWTLPSDVQQAILRDSPLASRTPALAPANLLTTFPSLTLTGSLSAINETPFPYSEVVPCIDISHLVSARCPPFIDWKTPKGRTGDAGYGDTQPVPVDARLAGDVGGNFGLRAGDRFGNVFCNSLGSDLLMAVQISAASLHALSSLALFLALGVHLML